MDIDPVPLLQIQRDLLDIPRGKARFDTYIRLIRDGGHMPLVAVNPMAREHVAARLDEWLAGDAETVAAAAAREAGAALADPDPRPFRHGLVLCDDVRGGWTNRWTHEAAFRFGAGDDAHWRSAMEKAGRWIVTVLWASESASVERLRGAVRMSVWRTHWIGRHGPAKTLGQMLEQEGSAGRFAGWTPHLDDDEIAYSRAVLAPHRDSDHWPTCVAAFFGDEAASALGYRPLGLSAWAGLAVALAEAG